MFLQLVFFYLIAPEYHLSCHVKCYYPDLTPPASAAQITLQDVKGDLEPAELAAVAAAPGVGGGGEGTAALNAAAETEQVSRARWEGSRCSRYGSAG